MVIIIIRETEITVQVEGRSAYSYGQSYCFDIDEKYNRFSIVERNDQINSERNVVFSSPMSLTIIYNNDKRRN
jgi:hypothetical protein